MNKLLIALNILFLTPSFAVGANFDNVKSPDVLNAPQVVEIDTSNLIYSLIKKDVRGRSLVSNFDFVGSDTSILGVDGNFVNSLNDYKQSPHRSIIGFDADVDEIERLTLKIDYKVYKKIDIFNWFPEIKTKTFVISSNVSYSMYSSVYLENVVDNYTNLGGYNALNPLMIGRVEDLKTVRENLSSVVPKTHNTHHWEDSNKDFIWTGGIYQTVIGGYKSVNTSALNDREWYVIMPVGFDISRSWISISYEKDGVYFGDGLGIGGLPNINLDGYKVITFKPKEIEYLYFTDFTTFFNIRFIPNGNYSNTKIDFGVYDYKTNKIVNSLGSLTFDSVLGFGLNDLKTFVLLPESNIGVSGEFSNGEIEIVYLSDGFATYMNIVSIPDDDGNTHYMPPDETPDISDDNWLNGFIKSFTDFFNKIQSVLKIVALIVLVGVSIWLISLLVKSIKNVKGDKSEK